MEEISQAIDLASDGKELDSEKRILKSIVEFSNIDVKEIMKARTDVVAVDQNTPYKEVLNLIVSSSFSRIPVFEDTFDDIKGVLYIKDLIPHLSDESLDWFPLCHDALFVPETKKINHLLKEFQDKWHFSSLERIFIENRIYHSIEDLDSWEIIISTIFDELKPFCKHLLRTVSREDVERLTEIKIKRITKFDLNRAINEINNLELKIKEIG